LKEQHNRVGVFLKSKIESRTQQCKNSVNAINLQLLARCYISGRYRAVVKITIWTW